MPDARNFSPIRLLVWSWPNSHVWIIYFFLLTLNNLFDRHSQEDSLVQTKRNFALNTLTSFNSSVARRVFCVVVGWWGDISEDVISQRGQRTLVKTRRLPLCYVVSRLWLWRTSRLFFNWWLGYYSSTEWSEYGTHQCQCGAFCCFDVVCEAAAWKCEPA